MFRTRVRALIPGALAAVVLLATACGEAPTSPRDPVAAVPSLHERDLMPPGMAAMFPFLSTSPCAPGELGEGPMLAISGSDVPMSLLPHPGAGGRIMAVNDLGVAVGFAIVGGQPTAYKWTPMGGGGYAMTALGNPVFAGGASEAWGINNHGDIVGYGRASTGAMRAVSWPGGTPGGVALAIYTTAPYHQASAATDINDAGKIVGYAGGVSGSSVMFRAMIFTTATATPVPGSTSYPRSSAYGVNAAGDVAGEVSAAASGPYQAARNLASVGSWEVLTPLSSFDRGSGQDINAFQHTVGYSQKLPANTHDRGAYWQPTAPALLDTVSTTGEGQAVASYAFGASSPANPADVRVVGWTNYTSGARRATLWQPGATEPIDLGKPAGACSTVGTSIADGGDFVCGYFYVPGQEHPICWEVEYPPELKSFATGDATCDEPATVRATFAAKNPETGPWHWVISWGDGTVSEGDAAAPGTIEDSHEYAAAGTYDVKITITDADGRSTTSEVQQVTKAPCPPEVTVVTTKASYTCDEPGAIVASFTSSSASAGPYTYAIDWGDGTTTSGTAATPGDIPASHDYAAGDGSYTVTVTVTNRFGESGTGQTTVVKEDCETRILTFAFAQGGYACGETASLSATFGSSSPTAGPWHYVFAWGDGQVSEGDAIAPGTITQTHTYLANGSYAATVTVTDRFGNAASATTTVEQAPCPPEIESLLAIRPTIGCGEPAQIAAEFSSNGAVGPFAYTIDWGDGTPATTGVGTPGETVLGSHLYAANGTFTITFTVQGAGGPSDSESVTVTRDCVPTKPKCDVCVLTPYVYVNQTATVSAKFTDATADGPWTYVIEWGDGQTTTGTLATLDNPITGTHTYATAGTYTVKVKVKDVTGAEGECEARIVVKPPPPPSVPRCDAGCSTVDYAKIGETVHVSVSFADYWFDGPWQYTIQWGDGTSSTGTVTSLSTRITGSHAYATAGEYNIRITVKDRWGVSGDCYTKVVVKPPPPPTPPVCETCVSTGYTKVGQSITVNTTFRDGSYDGPWTYEIDWGDGTPKTTGTKTSLAYGISGTHTYAVAGTYTIRVKVTDRTGAVGTCVTTMVVKPPPPPTPPVCRSCVSNTYARAGEIVNISSEFSDETPSGPYAYEIDWGDGSPKTTGTRTSLTSPITGSHVYTRGGYFTITVKIVDAAGQSAICTSRVTVRSPTPPQCESCTGSASYAKVNRTFTVSSDFSDHGEDGPWTYEIDWGDGTAKTTGSKSSLYYNITGSHVYTRTGTFTVKVKVTDRAGAVGWCTYYVVVKSY